MSIVVNIYYTGMNGSARKFAEEMISRGIVDKIRVEEGNERYEYFYLIDDTETLLLIDNWKSQEALDFHHKTKMMKEIAELRKKYQLKMKVEKFTKLDKITSNFLASSTVRILITCTQILIRCTNFFKGVRKLYQNRYLHTSNVTLRPL